MAGELQGRRVAALVAHGFEQAELLEPKKALENAGARVDVISPEQGTEVKGWNHTEWGQTVKIDRHLDQANPADYDALLLPGGVMNPDRLRMHDIAVRFARSFFDEGKPVAAICHGPWLLIDAGIARGARLTSWPSLKTDLRNAGAQWVDQTVVDDNGLVTSRKPDDIPAFNEKMIEEFARGKREAIGAAAGSRRTT
jgi:protease I